MVGKKRFGALAHAVGVMEQAREHSLVEQGPTEPRMSRMTRAARATVASVAAAAMLGAVCVAPASALADVNADAATAAAGASGSSVSAFKTQTIADASDDADAMPDNPNAELPDKVSSEIADDATVVSEQYAATPEGELKDIETGETVTDPKIVGTESKQPDPLAKTDGESFIPVSAADVKEKVAANGGDVNAVSSKTRADNASVQLAALQNNEYGAHWGSYNGTQAFFDAHNNLFAQQAKGVIDVSAWQNTIDWQAVKNAGVEGAIIRLSYGWGNGFDVQAKRNISECKRLGIPFGVYVFSYAESAADGASEGEDVVNLLRQAGVNPGDLSYPVFYDLENWTYTGHKSPTSPGVYDGIVNSWYGKLQSAGYNNLSVYSYTSYLNSALNSGNIHGKTRWVAQYGSTMQYTAFPTNDRGWQYTSGGKINGITGNVDLNAFGNKTATSTGGNGGGNGGNGGKSGWQTINGQKYWFDNGVMVRNKEVRDPATGKWYYLNADGTVMRGVKWVASSGGKWVYYDINTGEMRHGEQYLSYDREHTGWYYFDPGSGAMAHGVKWMTSSGGKWVYYDINTGQMRHGEQYLSYDRDHIGWYYFDPGSGAMAHGWTSLSDGRRVFYDRGSGQMVYGWQTIDGRRYYFNTATGNLERSAGGVSGNQQTGGRLPIISGCGGSLRLVRTCTTRRRTVHRCEPPINGTYVKELWNRHERPVTRDSVRTVNTSEC